MLSMLDPVAGESVLDIGCGSGASSLPLLEKGLDVTGIDPSPYMLDILAESLGNRISLYRGVAEDLPFDDNSFNHACLFTSLEFVDDPVKALEEAFRVAKDRVFMGFLNRYALMGIGRRVQGIFTSTIYNRANFYSVWEIKSMVRRLMGTVPVTWRTVCQFPGPFNVWMKQIEGSNIVQTFSFRNLCRHDRNTPTPVSYPSLGHSPPTQKCRKGGHRYCRLPWNGAFKRVERFSVKSFSRPRMAKQPHDETYYYFLCR